MHTTPPVPGNEIDRLAALHALGVLDTPPEFAYDAVTAHLASVWHAPISAVSLIDAHRQWFKSTAGLGVRATPRALSFCAHLLAVEDPALIVPDAREDARFADNPLVTGEPGIVSYAGVPLADDAGLRLGALCVIDRRVRRPSADEMQALERMAAVVGHALVLQRSAHRLARMATVDALTGLLNRKGLEAAARTLASGPATVLLIDMDGFKAINDTYGHAAGDVALMAAARRIRACVRTGDAVARLGGDEFVVLQAGADGPEPGCDVARRITTLIGRPCCHEGAVLPLAASIGAAHRLDGATTFEELLRRADTAMYAAKAARKRLRVA